MPIPLIAEITPHTDAYALVDDSNIRGSFRTVATIVDRNAIAVDKRKEGMQVYVTGTTTTYVLGSDLTTWTALTSGGGGPDIDSYVHTQVIASNVWNISHGMGIYPSVTVVDSGKNKVEGEVQYVDENNITLTFTAIFSGQAYLN